MEDPKGKFAFVVGDVNGMAFVPLRVGLHIEDGIQRVLSP